MPKADDFGFVPGVNKWPDFYEGQQSVRDRFGVIWLLCPEYDGGLATTATATGPFSVGTNMLRNLRGPLHVLNLTPEILDNFNTIQPESKLNEPVQEILAVTSDDLKD